MISGTIYSGVSDVSRGKQIHEIVVLYYHCPMTSAIRYSGPSADDPDATCPVCNKPMIITYTNKSRESGVVIQCPYCYEWLRFQRKCQAISLQISAMKKSGDGIL